MKSYPHTKSRINANKHKDKSIYLDEKLEINIIGLGRSALGLLALTSCNKIDTLFRTKRNILFKWKYSNIHVMQIEIEKRERDTIGAVGVEARLLWLGRRLSPSGQTQMKLGF